MMKNDRKSYNFILRLALTFILSLKNVCLIKGMEGTIEDQKKVYYEIDKLFCNNTEIKDAYEYLFNYETINESDKLSDRALGITNMFLFKYKKALKTGTREELLRIDSELEKIDRDFKALTQKPNNYIISDDDIVVISKYRLKYAVSREQIYKVLGISRKTLMIRENKILSGVLKQKINCLTEYYQDIFKIKGNIR